MNSSAWIDPRIRSVRVEGIRTYLLQRNWQLQPYPGPELLVFGGFNDDDGQPVIQVVPSAEHRSDFQMRVEELIAALSVMEDRPATEILNDILSAGNAANGAPRVEQRGEAAPK
jgi:hypothetical protein